MKKLEKLQGKKIGNLQKVHGGNGQELSLAGPCGGTGTQDDPHVLETVTILVKSGGGRNDGCD